MNQPIKQHLIDPEICIRCHSCEAACPIGAIEHDDVNVVVKADACNFCMSCIPVCPTGSIDEWRLVDAPYSLAEQYGWSELPAQQPLEAAVEAEDAGVAALLEDAHAGAGGRMRAPASASKPTVNLYTPAKPVEATVQGNYRLTADSSDVRHIILNFEGQSVPRARRPEPWRHRAGPGRARPPSSARGFIRSRARATASAPTSTMFR